MRKLRVLIVDDLDLMRNIARDLFETVASAEYHEAVDGLEAKDFLMRDPQIDVALVDWNMPRMNGLELLKFIKSHPTTSHICVVMITSECTPQNRADIERNRGDGFIAKPFILANAKKYLAMALTKRGLLT